MTRLVSTAVAVASALAGLLLVGCASNGPVCVKSHKERGDPYYIKSGNLLIPMRTEEDVCEKWVDSVGYEVDSDGYRIQPFNKRLERKPIPVEGAPDAGPR